MAKPKVVVLGARGLLGSDLLTHAPDNVDVLAWGREVDIKNKSELERTLTDARPDVIINAVAYSNVDGAERDATEADAVNTQGPMHLAELANRLKAILIHISTDYVFDGKKGAPYLESDPVSPTGKYAESKAAGERAAQTAQCHYILRTSALYGTGRINHAARMLEAIRTGQPVKLATDMMCSPTYTADLAQWIYDLIEKRPPFGLYHLVHKGCCSRFELGTRLCELVKAPKPYPIQSVTIAALNLPAPRPGSVCLSTAKWEKSMGELPTWQEGLARYLTSLGI